MEEIKKLTRNEIQDLAIEAAIPVLESEGRASLLMGTGTGKGLSILRILEHFNPPKITWLIDSQDGRDVNDSAEFYKWGYEHLLDRVEFSCYQTAYKWRDKDLGFLVCNEADYAATEEYSKGISENSYDKILMATATISESKQWFFEKYAPVVFTFTTQEAEDAGVVNKTIYKFVNYDLSKEKTIEKKGKYGIYKTSEEAEYIYWDNQFIAATIKYEEIKKKLNQMWDVFKLMPFTNSDGSINRDRIALKKEIDSLTQGTRNPLLKKLQYTGSQRSAILYKSETSAEVAMKIGKHILDSDDYSKVVVISKFTEHLDSIVENTWHSKNAGTKKNPSTVKDRFNSGEIRSMGVCGKVNRGANLVGANNFIWETYDGSATTGQQQGGRGKRLDVEDTCTIWILVPYFYKNGKRLPTRAYSFAMKRLADFELTEKNVVNLNVSEL